MGLWNDSTVVVDDCLHYCQDAKSKRTKSEQRQRLRLARYIMQDFPAVYPMRLYPEKDDMRDALGRHERRLIDAGYRATDIQEVWDHAWKAFEYKCLYMECYSYHFWRLLEAVEQETRQNRSLGLFHGPNSKGLLKARTDAFAIRMELQLQRNGADNLLCWEPNFEKMNGKAADKAKE